MCIEPLAVCDCIQNGTIAGIHSVARSFNSCVTSKSGKRKRRPGVYKRNTLKRERWLTFQNEFLVLCWKMQQLSWRIRDSWVRALLKLNVIRKLGNYQHMDQREQVSLRLADGNGNWKGLSGWRTRITVSNLKRIGWMTDDKWTELRSIDMNIEAGSNK